MGLPPTTAEISDMRTVSASVLPDTCTILRPTFSQGSQGGVTATFATFATNVKCRLDNLVFARREEEISEARVLLALDYWLYLPYDQDITEKDRVVHNGVTYEVSSVIARETWIFVRRAHLLRIQT